MKMTLKSLTILVAVLCIVAVVAAGCANRMILPSDDPVSSDSSPSPSPTSDSALPAQGNLTPTPTPSPTPTPKPESSSSALESSEPSEPSADETFEEANAITIPADYLEKIPLEQVLRAAAFLGVDDYTENEDGSVTFTIDPSLRDSLADTYAAAMRSFLSGLGGSDQIPGLIACSLNAEMDTLSLTVDEEVFDLTQSENLGELVYTPISIYRLLEGKQSGEFKLSVVVQNQKGDVLDTTVCTQS